MNDDLRIRQLLEEILVTGAAPEEVCDAAPQLLPEVRTRLKRLRTVEDQLEALFPSSSAAAADETASQAPPRAGPLPRVAGYEVEGVLGRGAMGVVYRARHLKLKRTVALKMLLTGAYASPQEVARFVREAEAVAALQHPHVVQVYDVGDLEGRQYFTMEFVEGGTLADWLAGVPQTARWAAEMVVTLAGAVQAAHASGIMHRDLKPSNILLSGAGTPKIADFGLARHVAEGPELTSSGARVGTPSYMAPEQALGRVRELGPAVDIYALGAILYEMLAGRPPFRAETAAETERQVISAEAVPPSRLNSSVPRDLETICLKCLRKEPDRRYASAAELADDLRRYLEGRPILARPIGRGARIWRWMRRNPMAAALLTTALAFVALAGSGGMWYVQQRARQDIELRAHVATAASQAASLRVGYHFREARELLEQASRRLEPAGPDELRRQVRQAAQDLDLAENLDRARLQGATLVDGRLDLAGAEPLYLSAFAPVDFRPDQDVVTAAGYVRNSLMRDEIVAALDDWASVTLDPDRRQWLLAVARAADPDLLRDSLRQPDVWSDGTKLTELAKKSARLPLSPQLATALGRVTRANGGNALPLLSAAQERNPKDFWLNFELGFALVVAKRTDEALGYYRAALSIRPETSVTLNGIGGSLLSLGRPYEALDHLQEALRLDPKNAWAHGNLAMALRDVGRLDEAVEHALQTVQYDPQAAGGHNILGAVLLESHRWEEALDQFEQALQLNPAMPEPRSFLPGAWYPAAAAAIRSAASFAGPDAKLNASERAHKRKRALGWLQSKLAQLAPPNAAEGARQDLWPLAAWQVDRDLVSVRDSVQLARLPEDEREPWNEFWADLARRLAETHPQDVGKVHIVHRRWIQAADCYSQIQKDKLAYDIHFWFEYCAVLLLAGDRQGYAEACARMIDTVSNNKTNIRAYHTARACTLAPGAVADWQVPSRLAEAELKASEGEFWSLTQRGALLVRAGQDKEALGRFAESLEAGPRPGQMVVNWLWLALANDHLGNDEEARRWQQQAQAWLDQFSGTTPQFGNTELGLHLHNWLEALVLLRELETLGRSSPRAAAPQVERAAP